MMCCCTGFVRLVAVTARTSADVDTDGSIGRRATSSTAGTEVYVCHWLGMSTVVVCRPRPRPGRSAIRWSERPGTPRPHPERAGSGEVRLFDDQGQELSEVAEAWIIQLCDDTLY